MARDWSAIAKELLDSKSESRAGVGLTSETDLSALQVAVLYNRTLAHDMLSAGVNCDLHSACALGLSDQIVDLSKKTDLSTEADLLPPLGWALLNSQVGATKTLLEQGDDPNRKLTRIGFFAWEIEALGEGSWRPIHLAVTHGYSVHAPELTNMLVKAGADLEAPCVLGEFPLHLACTYGWEAVIKVLLELGTDVDSRTIPCSEKVRKLSSPEGDFADHDVTPLMVAAREGKEDTAKLLLDRGSNVNARSANKRTALHMAANAWWSEEVKTVEVLLEAGADPNAMDESGKTPLDWAIQRNYGQVAAKIRSHAR